MATQTAFLSSTHQDLLTSLAFNTLSPHLLATSSLDSRIRIHARPPPQSQPSQPNGDENGAEAPAWEEVASFKAHEGPVLRVRWAEGEWGDLLASCGSDGTVRVWDQVASATSAPGGGSTPLRGGDKRWQQRACLVDARGSVRDLAFAPAEFGLRLATISADGCLRLYDCPDPSEGFNVAPGMTATAGMATWNLLEQIEPNALPLTPCNASTYPAAAAQSAFSSFGASSISLPGTTGSSQTGTGGASYTTVGTNNSSSGGSSGQGQPRPAGLMEADGGWTLSWCKDTWYGECLAVAAGPSGNIRIFHFTPASSWSQTIVLTPPTSARAAPISSLDWAPGSGRSYQLVAAGYRDGAVRIWKVWPPAGGPVGPGMVQQGGGEAWRAECVADLSDHVGGGGIGRVEWNLTGTVLSTAGDDGKVRLWKATYAGDWRSVATIACDEDPQSREDGMDG